jgi:tRNA 2-thiouridine synthesizing protein C
MAAKSRKIGLVVRSGPYQGRSSRDQLDIALAAATLGLELELFFTGEGVLQLLADRDVRKSMLPGSLRGWKSLAALTSVTAWVAESALASFVEPDVELILKVKSANQREIALRLAGCDQAMVI